MKPSLSVARLIKAGIKLDDSSISPGMSTSLVELIVDDGHEHWAGLHNFYVITRYNHSNMYAMAVYQLSQEIKKAYNSSQT